LVKAWGKKMNEVSLLGEFFSDPTQDQGIAGLIHYSCSQGVSLRFLRQISSQWIQPAMLFGILETGEECTLLEPVVLPRSTPITYRQHNGGSTVASGEVGYKYLVVGKHLELNEAFGEASFTFSGIGRFATGLDSTLQSHEAPLAYCAQTYIGKISIWRQDLSACMLNIKEAVDSDNRTALESLSIASDAIEKEYGCFFTKRLSSEYRMIIEFNSEVSLDEVFEGVQKIIDLISLLLYSPMMAEAVCISQGSPCAKRLKVYISQMTDERTLSIIESHRSSGDTPVRLPEILFPNVLSTWNDEYSKYATLVSGIQSRTGIKALHEMYADIILHCAFMESIRHEVGFAHKYGDCISRFACIGLQEKIRSVIKADYTEDIGVVISEIRADIVHFKGTRKRISSMSVIALCEFSQYLELTVIGYLLGRLGISGELRDRYQMSQSATCWTGI
jgi:hypothetical protein